GSTRPPKDPCPEKGGQQRARYKPEVEALARDHHLFLGQILTTTPHEDFWDAAHQHSRFKQYQIEAYLRAADDGWVLRKARYYRGAFQAEDEAAWGRGFLQWLLGQDSLVRAHFYLIRQAVRDLPHQADDNLTQRIRARSKELADQYAAFMDLRIKIHGQPEAADIAAVEAFAQRHRSQLTPDQQRLLNGLIADMKQAYRPLKLADLSRYVQTLPAEHSLRQQLAAYQADYGVEPGSPASLVATAELLTAVRQSVGTAPAIARLDLMDLSLRLEQHIFQEIPAWPLATLEDLLEKICVLSEATQATGLVERWEWAAIEPSLARPAGADLSLVEAMDYLARARALVEWGTGTIRATYRTTLVQYEQIEPLAAGFIDDRVRSSLLLPLGQTVGRLGDILAQQAGFTNQLLGIANPNQARGLNPGYAKGPLIVIDGQAPESLRKDAIYVFERPPGDMKPVAGIATVTEGNLVSHVQLLARNLGIPNAVLSMQNLSALKAYNGREVFYAVSPQGVVLMKLASEMSPEEAELFAVRARSQEQVRVPVDQLDLRPEVLDMRDLRADASGRLCGPKAANLGQLKAMFPDKVVEGLVIPFGIFRQHMDQPMPGQAGSYWDFLQASFAEAQTLRDQQVPAARVDSLVLARLAQLRAAIKEMPLLPAFRQSFEARFAQILGDSLGNIPVFLRSDTNMEDLKEFTGAGLNLTLFNVRSPEAIWQGIKDVWASPYTERSYGWRQRYLLNPEQVFPSILVIPSVNVAYSGVLITKGISNGDPSALTVAFSRGVGGAVDGQSAESYLLTPDGEDCLLSPAREPLYTILLPEGGSRKVATHFAAPILSRRDRDLIRELAEDVRRLLPQAPGAPSEGPYDVELGFYEGNIWLFQVRPFVENKQAQRSGYLETLSRPLDPQKRLPLSLPL
ncbi:MAG: phosphoenolpyruvate synthase, partial [Bacteroidetes bacterium]